MTATTAWTIDPSSHGNIICGHHWEVIAERHYWMSYQTGRETAIATQPMILEQWMRPGHVTHLQRCAMCGKEREVSA